MPITVFAPAKEIWLEDVEKFHHTKDTKITMEHSLVSISKWEAKYHKPFLHSEKTEEEILDYMRCMTINKDVDPYCYYCLTENDMVAVNDYISDPMTATTFGATPNRPGRKETFTNEVIYWYMIEFGIPFECEKWHFNRLWTLIQVCSRKQQPGKKVSAKDKAARYKAINEANRRKYRSNG